jgi:pimeloyl-ACP methyl ester carboxylesterase
MRATRAIAATALAALALSGPLAAAAQPRSPPAPAADCVTRGVGADSFCTVAGVRLHYVDWGGQGPAIILLAGLGSSARIFDDLAPRLTAGHRVLALTRRGYGQSDRSPTDYSNPALVSDILGLMDRLSITKASFVGHSIAGGELSTLGADHPDRVERLVYFDAAYDRTSALDLTNALPAGAPPTPADLASATAYAKWREGVLLSRSRAVRDDVEQVMAAGPRGVAASTPAPIMLKVFEGDIAAKPRYAAIPAPALAIYTSKDVADQIPPATAPVRRAEIIDDFTRHIRPWMLRAQADFIEQKACGVAIELPRSTHHFFLRSPDATAKMVLSYLAAQDPCHWRPPLDVSGLSW